MGILTKAFIALLCASVVGFWIVQQHTQLTLSELRTKQRRQSGITFEVDFINHEAADYSIKLDLTERVVVKQTEQGTLEITHRSEPQATPEYNNPFWQRYSGQSLLSEFTSGNTT